MKDFAQVEEKILVGLLITATVLVAQGYGNRCEKKDEIELYEKQNPATYICWPFPECLDGQEPTVEPGSRHPMGTDVSCQSCQQNFFSNKGTNIRCRKCTSCGKRLEVSPCLSAKDRECADMCISNGYYFNSTDKECHRCTKCCEGDNINIESQCIKLTPGTVIGGKGQKHCRRSSKPCNDLLKKNLTSSGCDCNCTVLSDSSFLKGSDRQMNCSLSNNTSLIGKGQTNQNLSSALKQCHSFDRAHIALSCLLGLCVAVIVFLSWLAWKRKKQSSHGCSSLRKVTCLPTCSSLAERRPFLTGSNSCQEKLNVIPEDIKLDKLPFEVETELIKMLNAKKAPLPNWWEVGRTIEIPDSDLDTMKIEENREGGSPTKSLLTFLSAMETVLSLKEFVQVIHDLRRHDICRAIAGLYQNQNSSDTP